MKVAEYLISAATILCGVAVITLISIVWLQSDFSLLAKIVLSAILLAVGLSCWGAGIAFYHSARE